MTIEVYRRSVRCILFRHFYIETLATGFFDLIFNSANYRTLIDAIE